MAKPLEDVARALVAPGKGILAADESSGTIEKRFKSIDVPSTEDNRRDYREMLFRTEGAEEFISGVILFDETIRQKAADGTRLVEILDGLPQAQLVVSHERGLIERLGLAEMRLADGRLHPA